MTVSLRDRFFGCIAGVHIGSAMAAPVEDGPISGSRRPTGLLIRFLPTTTTAPRRIG